MKNTVARSILLALSLLTSVAPITRVAHACGGYGASFDPNRGSMRTVGLQLKTALEQRDRAAALALFATDARIDLPEHRGSCGAPPTVSSAQWVERALRDRTFSLGNILGVSQDPATAEYVVHFVGGTRDGAAVNTLVTLRFIEARARITQVSQQFGAR